MSDLVKRLLRAESSLRRTRADMLGTDDEQHYADCHEAADAMKEAQSRIEQLEREWAPIETAPADGSEFLAFKRTKWGEQYGLCYRVQRDDCEMWSFNGTTAAHESFPHHRPTHWKPKPLPPKDTQ